MSYKKIIKKSDNKSIYHKVIQKTNSLGDFQGHTSIDVSPWEFNASKGLTLRIKVDKLGYGDRPSKSSFINIDIGNESIREALKQAIVIAETEKI
jgi:hypothetical protein